MGIFDFIKDLGTDKKAEAAADDKIESSISEAIQKTGLGLKDFQISLSKGTAVISGIATSLKDAELARLMVGNHRGVERVNDDALKVVASTPTPLLRPEGVSASPEPKASSAAPQAKESIPAKMFTVRSGDTLSKIAKDQLGSANRYPEIFEANRPMLKDPDAIYPGQVLRIPQEAMRPSAH